MRSLAISAIFIISFQLHAQQVYQLSHDWEVVVDGRELSMPFAGGINAAQIQTLDVDGDGIEELVIWDINARMVSVIKEVEGTYTHLPNYSFLFPSDISGFLVLADYDGDGKKDLFTSSPFGIKAYRNRSSGSRLQWEEAQPFLRLDNGSNVTANNLDIPLILDLDGDGDLDILTFNFATGDYLEYYRNTSMERKGILDIDGFASAQPRWGLFEFCGCGNISFGQTCNGAPINGRESTENARVEHAGGHSMLYHDFDEDGVRDLLIGQDECSVLYFLPNKGTDAAPLFDSFGTSLPGIGPLPQFPIFHAAYLLPENIIITTHSSEPSAGFRIDFGSSLYKYSLNTGSSDPLTKRFLQEDMVDLGENARPFFEGNQRRGTLIVTANETIDGNVRAKATKFELNNGILSKTDDDYLGLSRLGLREMTFQRYVSAGGHPITLISGDEISSIVPEKKLFWTQNDTGELREASIPDIISRGVDQPLLFSYQTRDYLLLARQSGELMLFAATFGENLTLELLERDFLGFADNPVSRGLSVSVLPGTEPILIAIDQRGLLMRVDSFMSRPQESEVLIQLAQDSRQSIRFGRNTWIAPVSGTFPNETHLVLGTRAGGLVFLRDLTQQSGPGGQELSVRLFPNPSVSGASWLVSNKDAEASIADLSGRIVASGLSLAANQEYKIDLPELNTGIYLIRVVDSNDMVVKKWILTK